MINSMKRISQKLAIHLKDIFIVYILIVKMWAAFCFQHLIHNSCGTTPLYTLNSIKLLSGLICLSHTLVITPTVIGLDNWLYSFYLLN